MKDARGGPFIWFLMFCAEIVASRQLTMLISLKLLGKSSSFIPGSDSSQGLGAGLF